VVKKKAVKKWVSKKKVAFTGGTPRKKFVKKKVSGYVKSDAGIYVPEKIASIVPPSRLRKGFAKAKEEINGIIEEIIDTMTEDYVISEIEFNASFSADGKFMGIGVGGAASIKIKVTPDRK
jgi:hypothetical protein